MEFVPLKMVCHLYQPIPCHAYILEYISNKNIRMYSLINLNIGHWTWHHFGEWQSAREIPIIYMAGTFPWYVCFKILISPLLIHHIQCNDSQWWTNDKKWWKISLLRNQHQLGQRIGTYETDSYRRWIRVEPEGLFWGYEWKMEKWRRSKLCDWDLYFGVLIPLWIGMMWWWDICPHNYLCQLPNNYHNSNQSRYS